MRPVGVLVFKDVGRDLNQKGVQLCLVPAVERLTILKQKGVNTTPTKDRKNNVDRRSLPKPHLRHLIVVHPQDVLHQVVGLADQLHVSILDAVVDHFYKVTRALVSDLPQQTHDDVSRRRTAGAAGP